MYNKKSYFLGLLIIAVFSLGLWLGFPAVARFLAMVALEVRYLWWLILAVALIGYLLVWAGKRKQ